MGALVKFMSTAQGRVLRGIFVKQGRVWISGRNVVIFRSTVPAVVVLLGKFQQEDMPLVVTPIPRDQHAYVNWVTIAKIHVGTSVPQEDMETRRG